MSRAKLALPKKLSTPYNPVGLPSEYVGWIPNVAGRLSFSHVGRTRHPSSCQTFNEDDGQQRLIVCAQDRNLSDALVGAAYFRFVYGYDPRWTFLLVADTQAVGHDRRFVLRGRVYAFNRSRWIQSNGEDHPSGLRTAETLMEHARHAAKSLAGFDKQLLDHRKVAEERLNNLAVYTANIQMDRRGIARISLHSISEGLRFTPAVTMKAAPLGPGAQQYLCNQAYFFLKDISHEHRHHHKKSDTITAAYLYDTAQNWIRETQYGIHRRVVAVRRGRSPLTAFDALGLLAYMKSFREVIDQLPKSDGKHFVEQYNLSETEDSIKAVSEGKKWSRSQQNIMITAVPAVIIGLTAILRSSETNSKTMFDVLTAGLRIVYSADMKGALAVAFSIAMLPLVYGVVHPTRLRSVMISKRLMAATRPRDQIRLYAGCGVLTVTIAAISVAQYAMGKTDGDQVWFVAFSILGGLAVAFKFAPYAFTLGDLGRALIAFPEQNRADLSSDTAP